LMLPIVNDSALVNDKASSSLLTAPLKKFTMCKRKFEKYHYKARIIGSLFCLEALCVS